LVAALSAFLNRFVASFRSRTAANGLSTTFVVLRSFQWSTGNSRKVTIRSQYFSMIVAAFE
jgi:hypothetical protein